MKGLRRGDRRAGRHAVARHRAAGHAHPALQPSPSRRDGRGRRGVHAGGGRRPGPYRAAASWAWRARPGHCGAPGSTCFELEEQPFVLIGGPAAAFPDGDPVSREAGGGRPADRLPTGQSDARDRRRPCSPRGAALHIVAEVAHRTSILPLVFAGRRARRAALGLGAARAPGRGARSPRSTPTTHLHVALLSRSAPLTPAARGVSRSPPTPFVIDTTEPIILQSDT